MSSIFGHGIYWYIARSRWSQGERMDEWLKQLRELSFDVYYPIIREMKRVPRRLLSRAQRNSGVGIMRPRDVPFLPGCVFVKERADIIGLADMPGMLGFISFGEGSERRIACVPERELERIRRREIDGVLPGATPADWFFKVGERVRVINGPFTAFDAIIENLPRCPIEQIDGETRLRLTIEIFGRPTPTELAVADVCKL